MSDGVLEAFLHHVMTKLAGIPLHVEVVEK